jgi:GT2 family glycosyltransferase
MSDPSPLPNTPAAPRRLAVVIATHGRPTLLERTLRTVGAADDPGVPVEIVVIENGGRMGAEALCRDLELPYQVTYRFVAEGGKSRALNRVLPGLDADLLVFFDDDVRVAAPTLRAYHAAALRHGPGHFFGGPFEVDYEAPPPVWLTPHLPASAVGWSLGDAERTIDRPDFIGVDWAAFRDDILAAGGFAEHLGPNPVFRTIGQETDMQKRLLARGARGVYVPEAFVRHFVPRARCSVAWALERYERTFFSFTMGQRSHPAATRLGGVPLWLWKQAGLHALRVQAARLRGLGWERRIGGEMALAADRGSIQAFRLMAKGVRWPTGPAAPLSPAVAPPARAGA